MGKEKARRKILLTQPPINDLRIIAAKERGRGKRPLERTHEWALCFTNPRPDAKASQSYPLRPLANHATKRPEPLIWDPGPLPLRFLLSPTFPAQRGAVIAIS